MKNINISGQKFGRLTAIRLHHFNKGHYFWLFECICGNKPIIEKYKARTGETKSCGCIRSEKSSERFTVHGMGGTKFNRAWNSMKRRVLNPKCARYKSYGGRGIKLCIRWNKFENFKADMYESFIEHCQKFGESQTTLERIDVNGNYCKSNCRWATWGEQALNKNPANIIRARDEFGRFVKG